MLNTIAIRKENIEMTEKRSPLSPKHVSELISKKDLKVILEPWDNRHLKEEQYVASGVKVSDDLTEANVIFGVKETPIDDLPHGQATVFFSHTIKGQSYNMPLLQAVLDKNVTLMDYEKVTDEYGRRLIFFGPYAGLAGAINSIWLLGQRLKLEGIDNPFQTMKQANKYGSLDEAKAALKQVGEKIKESGLPNTGKPWVIAITGNGTVSKGAQEIVDILPVKEVIPPEFRALQKAQSFDLNTLYKVVIDCDNFVKPVNKNNTFDWQDYFTHPEKYEADFEGYIPDLTVLINGIFWDTQYPKLVTKQNIKDLFEADKQPNLRIIADITCDVEGSIECNLKSTASDNPTYVFDAFKQTITDGIEGNGPVILAVDKLPSELPGEATQFFGDALMPFVPDLANVDFTVPFEKLEMPAPFKRAMIAHQGKLTPDFEYLKKYL
jgi:alanine dehydrogenase